MLCCYYFTWGGLFPQVNLASLIDHSGSECLNESDDHPFTNCLKTNAKYLESDCDPQLIIVLAFTQSVKLHTMQIIAPTDGRVTEWVWAINCFTVALIRDLLVKKFVGRD